MHEHLKRKQVGALGDEGLPERISRLIVSIVDDYLTVKVVGSCSPKNQTNSPI